MVEQKSTSRLPLVLLPGWGFDRRIWDELMPWLQPQVPCVLLDLPGFAPGDAPVPDLTEATARLLAQLPPRCVLLGWSLGGLLATHIAIHHAHRIAALMTVGSNLKWVGDPDGVDAWPGATADNFAAFFENLAHHFEATLQHFCGVIARGDRDEKNQIRLLRNKLAPVPQANYLAGLRLLDSIDNRAGFAQLAMPGLHVFGEKDVMVPAVIAERLRSVNAQQRTIVMPGLAHQPFLSEPQQFAAQVLSCLSDAAYQLDKKHIAQSFGRAAFTYDDVAGMQRDIGDHLFSRLPQLQRQPQRVLDLGCGTGTFSPRLQQRFPQAQVISLDLAEGMLQYARRHHGVVQVLCADAEQLPLANDSMDVLYSNLAIQWCRNTRALFCEAHRVLSRNGVAVISTFVEGTLSELREAWSAVDDRVHVNRFPGVDEIQASAQRAGFVVRELSHHSIVRYYETVTQLSRELKQTGAHNVNAGRSAGLTGKQTLRCLQRAYEPCRDARGLPAHYEVVYLVLEK